MWSDDLCGIGRKRTLGSQGDNADNTHGSMGVEQSPSTRMRGMWQMRPVYLILL